MNRLRWIACAVVVIAVHSVGLAGTLHFEQNGFTIDALEDTVDGIPYQVLAMYLPPTPDGFTPNINIIVQPYDGSFDGYIAESKDEMEILGLAMLDIRVFGEEEAVTFEYAGEMFGARLRWYVKAVPSGDKIYLITATASLDYWSEISERLVSTVESFQLDSVKASGR